VRRVYLAGPPFADEYRRRDGEVLRRYGRRLAARTSAHLEQIRGILAVHGTYPAFAAVKP